MSPTRVVVVGGGFAGIASSVAAAKAGAQVTLFEKTDMLSGSGLRAGRMNSNGRLVAAEEAKALGGGEVLQALESILLHRGNDEFQGYIYDTSKVDTIMQRLVKEAGVELRAETRVTDVEKHGNVVGSVVLASREKVRADAFVDAPGTSGGMSVCKRYGQGCVMCICCRCPAYGDRVSIATKAGARSLNRVRPDGTPGVLTGAVFINKTTLAPALLNRLQKEGFVSIPLAEELIDYSKQKILGGLPRSRRQMEFIELVDIGSAAKCVGLGYLALDKLRSVAGFEFAQYDEPMAGGKFNKISHVDMCLRDDSLRVEGFENLFAAGEKCGPAGIAEAVVSGVLAGNNAARIAAGKKAMILPRDTAIGDFIAYTGEKMKMPDGLKRGYSFALGEYFERMKELGTYTTDTQAIHDRITRLGLKGVFARKVIQEEPVFSSDVSLSQK